MKKIFIPLIFLLFAACASPSLERTEGPTLIEPAGLAGTAHFTARAEIGTVEQVVVRHGLVRVESEPLAFEVSGRIYEISVFPGDLVRAGQVIARLDTADFEEAVSRQEEQLADLIRANAVAEEMFAHSAALRLLDYADAIREAGFDAQAIEAAENILVEAERAELLHAQSAQRRALDIAEARRRLEERRDRLADTSLRTPADGIVTYIAGDGRAASAGVPFIYINFSPEVFIEDVDENLPFTLRNSPRIQARVNGLIYDVTLVEMTLEEIAIAQQNDTPLRWRFEITPQSDGTMPPQGAYASIVYSSVFVAETLRVPSNAVSRTYLGHFVDREIGEGVFERISVRVGAVSDTFTEILEGLEEGDVVLVL